MTPPLGDRAPTREVLWGVHGPAEIFWYVLAVISVAVFAYGVLRPVAKYMQGRRDPDGRGAVDGHAPRAVRRLGARRDLLRLRRSVRRDRDPGDQHGCDRAAVRLALLPRRLLPRLLLRARSLRARARRRPRRDG